MKWLCIHSDSAYCVPKPFSALKHVHEQNQNYNITY